MSPIRLYFKPVSYLWAMLKVHWWRARGFSVLVPGAEWSRRQAICHGCQFYSAEADECGVCGCPVEAKTPLASESCPKRFWLAIKRR